ARPGYPEVVARLDAIALRLGEPAAPPPADVRRVAPEPTPFLGGRARTRPGSPTPAVPARRRSERPPISRALAATTALALAVFVPGLATCRLAPRRAAAPAAPAAPAADAGAAAARAPAPPPPPPEGMVLAAAPDGTPLAYVDLAPVSRGDHAAFAAPGT